ncbi:MAG TPA: PilZ domain-containing protein [Candidatus Eremiobacteraceae bacterium]|nr:PilZ domain-containing protein [Candidatus Eremiobacteraceae bacterium]
MSNGADSRSSHPGAERRAHDRVARSMPVHLHKGQEDKRFDAKIVNISAGGMLIETEMPLSQNDLLTIDLDLAGEKEPIYVYGTVIRNDARGTGVSFVRVSEITSDLINYLIRKTPTA